MRYFSIILIFLFLSCNQNENNKGTTKSDSLTKGNNLGTETKIYKPDSLEQAYMDGKYFNKYFIRLYPNNYAYIYIDSEYVEENFKNKKLKELFFKTDILTSENRETYYKSIISGIPKEDLDIHKIVWKIKEIRDESKESTGGFLSVATKLTRPDEENDYYSIAVIKDYYDQDRPCFPIPFLNITKKHKIFVWDTSPDETYTLDEWREKEKNEAK
jgi:hypothetical protein